MAPRRIAGRAPVGEAVDRWDEERILGYRNAQPQILRDLYVEYYPFVHHLLARPEALRLGPGQGIHVRLNMLDLEDLTQEVFVRAFSAGARQAWREGPFRNYLAVITRNALLDHLRGKQVKLDRLTSTAELPDVAAEVRSDFPINDGSDPARTAEQHEAQRTVAEFRRQLDGPEAQVFDLRFLQDTPQQDAARALNIRRGKLRGLEDRVRRRFVRFLRLRGMLPC